MPQTSYLLFAPDRPTPEEYAKGAKLIPSMLDEGLLVWRVPMSLTNHLGETPEECTAKLLRYSGCREGATVAAWKQLLYYYRSEDKEDLVRFYDKVLSLLSRRR